MNVVWDDVSVFLWRYEPTASTRSVDMLFKEFMNYREPDNIGSMSGITQAVKFLLILNVVIFLVEGWFGVPLSNIFALQAGWYRHFAVGQLFTYMFVHANMSHLIMNMLGLFFIGPTVERTVGSYRFFMIYYLSGILGGLGWSLLADPNGPSCVGASGAVFGVLGAFGAFYPNAKLLLYFIIPVRAWVLVSGLALWELFATIRATGGVANAAHLVGGVAGFYYAFSMVHPHPVAEIKRILLRRGKRTASNSNAAPSTISKEDMDQILDKIGKKGMGALTLHEREMLKRAVRRS